MPLPNRVYMPNAHYIDLTVSQTLSLGAQSKVEGNILPDVDDQRNLGGPQNRFATVHARALSITDGVVFDDQAANRVLAGPTTGANAAASFRALVEDDLPATAVVESRAVNTTFPLTGGGDLSTDRTIAFSNQSANTVLAGPASGGAAAPAFRSLVAADLSAAVPSGLIMLSLSACPSGYTEVTALSGKFALGTLAAAGDVGGTGGSTSYTPAGTNSVPIFTGNQVNTSAVSAGTPTGTVDVASGAVTAETGTFVEAADAVHTHGFTGDALAAHQHTVTATGSVSAPTFTGTPATIQPPFVKVIFCQKD